MTATTPTLAKISLPDSVRRELRKGETIYHSAQPCYVSKKFPEGKWVAHVRREERGILRKYPIKAFGTPREALHYVKSIRPGGGGSVTVVRGEPTVSDLYLYVTTHRQKRLLERTKREKARRWEMHIKPEWGYCPLSKVTHRAAQEWVTSVEERIGSGEAGSLGLAQFEKIRTDLHALFECLGSFSEQFEDRRNPFAGLDFTPPPPRHKTTIESQFFAATHFACLRFAHEGHCTQWVTEMFLTSLFSGLRLGEVYALCDDQVDFEQGAIVVDRSMRRDSRAIDQRTRLEVGSTLRMAISYPKGGSPTVDKTRVVPMSDQLSKLLKPIVKRTRASEIGWPLLWPGEAGNLRELARFSSAWRTLRGRLDELAIHAPVNKSGEDWPPIPSKRGREPNVLIATARRDPAFRLPDVFSAIDFRDTRNSFASYMNELGLSQATREHILGHGGGLTNTVYTVVTSGAFQDARQKLSNGWSMIGSAKQP